MKPPISLIAIGLLLLVFAGLMVWAQPETLRKTPPEPMVLVVYISPGGITEFAPAPPFDPESARVCEGRSAHHSILVPLDEVATALAEVDAVCGLVLAVDIQ